MTLRPYQRESVDAVYRHLRERDDNPCVVLPTGCHAAGHPILMFDGTVKAVQDVAVGDVLIGPDSEPRHVMALCRGEGDLYRIIPHRGQPFVVNGDHVLALVCTNEGKRAFPCYRRGGEIETIAVREYQGKSKSWKHLRKLFRVPLEFCARPNLPIPPYILGLLLGDGSLTSDVVELTTADEATAEAWIEYAHCINNGVAVREAGGRCPTYRLVRGNGKYNVVTESLTALGLAGRNSATKFIPHMYLTTPRSERLALLAGLMDSDGHANKSGCDYITKSRELATDLMFLVRSLGFAAHCAEKYCACQTGSGGWFFRISIWGDFSEVPCRLARRQPRPRRQKKCVLRTGFRIEPFGHGPYYGFVLDGDHLYVDGHFVVHHNSGKTPVMATICSDAVQLWSGRVLILAHVKELLGQAAEKLQLVAPDLPLGIYSAGLNRRDLGYPVTIAGIQSVYQKACDIGPVDLVIVDEAHLIPPDGEGMYRQLLSEMNVINPNVRVIGLTATPFRMKSGTICAPDNILNAVCYEVGVRELIVQGYLCGLRTKAGLIKPDTQQLHVRGGEYIACEVEDLMDDQNLVLSACREIIEYTHDRNSVLIFASGVSHGQHIAEILRTDHGVECGFVCGETPSSERDAILNRFKARDLKYLCNVNVLTTGFDATGIDCVALVRPTLSPGLYYQMCGRGFRLHPGKTDCLVLDFGGNVLRHGPVDAIRVTDIAGPANGEAPAKECPECRSVIAAGYSICPDCGYVFPERRRSDHDPIASSEGILSDQIQRNEFEVLDTYYAVHEKRNAAPDAPRTLRVEYKVGFNDHVSEWVCFEHDGFARQKAESWWLQRSHDPIPGTAERAVELAEAGAIATALSITVERKPGERFERVVGYKLGPKPASPEYEDDVPWYAADPADEEVPF